MLNFNQLRAFYQAAKSLNFTAAARNLYVSQPAVTAQIKLFEDFCKFRLFRKRGNRMDLTEDGKVIFRYASKVFDLERDIEVTIDDLRKAKQGHLSLATTRTYARYLIPYLLALFHKSFPGITIELNEGTSSQVCQSLLDFRNSLAIMVKFKENPNIDFIPFMQEEVLLIVPPNHHLATRDEISIQKMAEEPVIMLGTNSGSSRKLIEGCFRDAKRNLNIITESSNVDFIKQLVKEGEGVSFLVRSAVRQELREGSLTSIHIRNPITNRRLLFNTCIWKVRNSELPSPAKVFLGFVKSLIKERKPFSGIDSFMAAISIRKK